MTNHATTVMIRARAAITMIAHSVTQIANGTRRFRCMFGQIKRGEAFYTIQKTSPRVPGGAGPALFYEGRLDLAAMD